jgi:hypothetical protein
MTCPIGAIRSWLQLGQMDCTVDLESRRRVVLVSPNWTRRSCIHRARSRSRRCQWHRSAIAWLAWVIGGFLPFPVPLYVNFSLSILTSLTAGAATSEKQDLVEYEYY